VSDAVSKQDRELAEAGYPEALRTSQVCRALGVHQQTVLKLVREGTLSAFRLNAQIRVRRHDLAHFLVVSRVR